MLGAYHYRSSLLISLITPAILSCLTLLTPQSGLMMLVQIVASLVFYSFLLLPTALKFDFRRDIDRLGVLKALPISVTAVTLGELAVPVLLCTLFQAVVLLAALLIRPFPVSWCLMVLVVLLPVNLLIFALENLIFLLYPYRLSEEGVSVFFRSILTFTGKGLLFALGLAVTLVWALISKQVGARLPVAGAMVSGLFVAGMWVFTASAAATTTCTCWRVVRDFDASQDAPAVS